MKHMKKSKVVIFLSVALLIILPVVILIGVLAGTLFLRARVVGANNKLTTTLEGGINENSQKKNLELYVWKNKKSPADNRTYFTLLEATDRQKYESEVYDFAIAKTSIEEINKNLSNYPKDTVYMLRIKQMNVEDFTKTEMVGIGEKIVINSDNYLRSIGLAELLPDNYTVENFINDLGYEIIVNSSASIEIQLPQSFDVIVEDTDFIAGEFFKDRNEKSKELTGIDFSNYLGQQVKVYTYGIEEDGISKGELISLVNNSGIIGAWIDETRAHQSKLGSDDFSQIVRNLVDMETEKEVLVEELPTMHVNANNSGLGIEALRMHYLLWSGNREEYENHILKVNPENEIKLKIIDVDKIDNIIITGIYGSVEKGLKFGEYIYGDSFKAPKELGIYFYEAIVEMSGETIYYPFKFEVTLENQMSIEIKDLNRSKITKVEFISNHTDENNEVGIKDSQKELLQEFVDILHDVAGGVALVNFIDQADYTVKIYLTDGRWIQAEYRTGMDKFNFRMDHSGGDKTIDGKRMDALIEKATKRGDNSSFIH